MLSAHSLLIAAIFTAYISLMSGLFAYICHTGRPREERQDDSDEGDPGPAALPVSA